MNVKLEDVEKNVVKLEIEVDNDAFEKGMQKSYIKNVKYITLPGFRKGKAPRKMIEKMYGESVFYDDAVNFIIPDAYEAAVEEKAITPVDQPEIDVVQIGEGKSFIFSAKVTVKPEVVLGDYKGIEVEKVEYTVSDEDIDAELSRMQNQNARIKTVEDRPAQNGDTVVIDFEGFVDGVAFEGGKGENYSLELGSGSFIPGFEDQLVGKNKDEEAEVNVTFPEDYHAEELKGKAAVFKVKIHEVKEKELPALDDEFAKDTSEFDTLDELKKDIRAKKEKEAENRTRLELESKVLEKVANNATIDIPACMVEHQIDKMMNDFAYRLQGQGLTLDKYMEYTGMDKDKMRDQFRPGAEPQVRTNLVVEKINQVEGIEATDEDVEAEYAKMAEQYGMELDKVKEIMQANEQALRNELKMTKTVDMLIDSAVLTEKKADKKEDKKENKKEKKDTKETEEK